MVIDTIPGEVVHLQIVPSFPYEPACLEGNEYDYLLHLDGIVSPVSTEGITWGSVKAMYRVSD
jgi:hypothetical protein